MPNVSDFTRLRTPSTHAFSETDPPPGGTAGVVRLPETASAVCLDREPLARFRIASADRPEDALAIQMLRSEVYRISSPSCDEAYRFRLNLASLAGMRIGFVSHGRPTRVDLRGSASVSITWTEKGHGRVITRGRSMVTSTDQGALAVPDQEFSFDYGQNCRRIVFGFVPGVIERYLTSALGFSPRGDFSLHPEFDMSAGAGAALKRFVRFVTAELDCDEAILTNSGAAAGLQDAVISMLLQHHPHSHSRHFNSAARTAVPAVVRRVEEYLATQATEAVSMTDLPPVAGVGLRTIQATFKKHRGYSPQEFLKSIRLDEAHRQLRSGHPSRVIDVAYECGFTKLSRFSADYAKRFGELPSKSLGRGRGNSRS